LQRANNPAATDARGEPAWAWTTSLVLNPQGARNNPRTKKKKGEGGKKGRGSQKIAKK